MTPTGIELLTHRWDIITGCSEIGCAIAAHCWAQRGYRGRPAPEDFTPSFHPQRLMDPRHAKRSCVIGVAWGGEFFDQAVDPQWRCLTYSTVKAAQHHEYLFLTKHPENIDLDDLPNLPCIHIGVSVTSWKDMHRVEKLGHILLHKPNIKTFVFFEPVLGPIWEREEYSWTHARVALTDAEPGFAAIGAVTRSFEVDVPVEDSEASHIQQAITLSRAADVPIFLKNNVRSYISRRLLWDPAHGGIAFKTVKEGRDKLPWEKRQGVLIQ